MDAQAISPAQLRQVARVERRLREQSYNTSRGRVPHRKRPTIEGSGGVHVTWKLVEGIPSLRQKRVIEEFMGCFRAAKSRFALNLIGYTVMENGDGRSDSGYVL